MHQRTFFLGLAWPFGLKTQGRPPSSELPQCNAGVDGVATVTMPKPRSEASQHLHIEHKSPASRVSFDLSKPAVPQPQVLRFQVPERRPQALMNALFRRQMTTVTAKHDKPKGSDRATRLVYVSPKSAQIDLLLLLLLHGCCASAVASLTGDSQAADVSNYSHSSLPPELFNEHRTRSQAAGTNAHVNFQTLSAHRSMMPSHPPASPLDSKRPVRTFDLFGTNPARVAVVNPYQWSYPTIAAIAEAVRASGIQPEVQCSPKTTVLPDLLLDQKFNDCLSGCKF